MIDCTARTATAAGSSDGLSGSTEAAKASSMAMQHRTRGRISSEVVFTKRVMVKKMLLAGFKKDLKKTFAKQVDVYKYVPAVEEPSSCNEWKVQLLDY